MDEAKYVEKFLAVFSPKFDLHPQVWMRHPVAGRDLRIDFVGFDKENYMLGPIGFEIKDPERWEGNKGSFSGFTDSLAQCVDYQDRVINTQTARPELNQWFYRRLRYTFLFPVDPAWAYDHHPSVAIPALRGGGALRLAGKFGVGAACHTQYGWMLTLGAAKVYTIKGGPSELFLRHAVATRSGAAR